MAAKKMNHSLKPNHSPSIVRSGFLHYRFGQETHPDLVRHAVPILNVVSSLKQKHLLIHSFDINSLRKTSIRMLAHYRQTLTDLAINQQDNKTAHYILCATIDDAVLGQSVQIRTRWAECGLTAHFHRDINSGNRFFELIEKALTSKKPNKPILLLLYYCLSISFEGRLRLIGKAQQEKQKILDRLYQALSTENHHKLATTGRHSEYYSNKKLKTKFNTKTFILIILLIFNAMFIVIFYTIIHPPVNRADELSRRFQYLQTYTKSSNINKIKIEPSIQEVKDPPQLSQLLQPEIINKDISVTTDIDGNFRIRILKSPLFASASDMLDDKVSPLIERITAALTIIAQKVVVMGYSDSQPIHSAQFASNQILSQARAAMIAALLQPSMPNIPITAIGKGDLKPIASNETAEGRALNRRIEIYLSPKINNVL